jgi:glycosyltransferase involved in cell wall biosynthesis
MTHLHFDDIIYRLQRHGGVSVYWQEVTSRLQQSAEFSVTRRTPGRWFRSAPDMVKCDLYHSSYNRFSLMARVNVLTVHDLSYELGYLDQPGRRIKNAVNILERRLAIAQADAYISVSQNTLSDLQARYPALVRGKPSRVVHHGSGLSRREGPPPSQRLTDMMIQIRHGFILFVGRRDLYKNFAALARAFQMSGACTHYVHLVCVGEPFSASELRLLTELGIVDRTKLVSRADPPELEWLYSNAVCLAYLSRYEGFGIPLLEAMRCGCPIVSSNTSSVPEVVGEAGLLVDPQNLSEIAHAIDAFGDPTLRAHYVELGYVRVGRFSWEQSAKKHLELYREVLRKV